MDRPPLLQFALREARDTGETLFGTRKERIAGRGTVVIGSLVPLRDCHWRFRCLASVREAATPEGFHDALF